MLRGRLDRAALRDTLEAFALSRLLVFGVGAYAMLTLDPRATESSGYAAPYGAQPIFGDAFEGWPLEGLWEMLFHPLTQWDAGWLLAVANDGYSVPTGAVEEVQSTTAFFPLYPLLVRALGLDGGIGVLIVAAHVLSAGALLAALYLLHRLTTIELGRDAARATVLLLAFFPTAFFFSAPYTESLFLALAVGCLYAARTDHWAVAGLLAGLATATRNTGVALLPALLVMYLYGPRAAGAAAVQRARRFMPRFRPRPNVMWLGLGLAGVGGFTLYLELEFGDGLRWVENQEAWRKDNALLSGTWRGVDAAVAGAGDIVGGERSEWPPGANDPYRLAAHDILNVVVLAAAVAALVGVARRLPAAYLVYALAALVPAVSSPEEAEALKSFARYVLVIFPLFMWAGLKLAMPEWTLRAVAVSGLGLGLLTAQFATVQWVA